MTRRRKPGESAPIYDSVTHRSLYTIKLIHGGDMIEEPCRHYINGTVDYFDYVEADEFGAIELLSWVEELGYEKDKTVIWYKFGHTLHLGARVLNTDEKIYGILKDLPQKKEHEIYLIKFELPDDGGFDEWEVMSDNLVMVNVEFDAARSPSKRVTPTEAAKPSSKKSTPIEAAKPSSKRVRSKVSSKPPTVLNEPAEVLRNEHLETTGDGTQYSNLGVEDPVVDFSFLDEDTLNEQSEGEEDGESDEYVGSSECDEFNDSDYDMHEDDADYERYVDVNAEFDGVDKTHNAEEAAVTEEARAQIDAEVEDVYEDNSDGFESAKDSDDEEESEKFEIYNPKTDGKNPNLKLGLVFSCRQEAKDAIETHCIRRGMSYKFVKIDNERLRARDGRDQAKRK